MATYPKNLVGVVTQRAYGDCSSSLVRRIELIRTSKSFAGAAAVVILACQSIVQGETSAPATSDPFAAATAKQAGEGNNNPFRATGADRYATPAAATTQDSSDRARSDQFLLDARRALSVGDVPRAQQFVSQAQQLKVAYEGPGDSPQSVAAAIRECQELSALRGANGGAAWRTGYATFLVAQADALLAWNDLDTATRAANEASQLNPDFTGTTGPTPDDVLRRIADRRKNSTTSAVAEQTQRSPAADAKGQTLQLLAQARAALATGNVAEAQALAGKASSLNVPDSQFAPHEDRPSRLALDLQKAAIEGSNVKLAGGPLPTTSTPGATEYAQAAASSDIGAAMRMAQVPEFAPQPLPADQAQPLPNSPAAQMLEAGEAALKSGDRAGALESFRAAYDERDQLDLISQQKLQGHLQMLSGGERRESIPAPEGELLDSALAGQSVLARQLSADIMKMQSEAKKVRESDPNRSLQLLGDARLRVEESELGEDLKTQLLSRIDMGVAETEKYIHDHKHELELNAANKETEDEIARRQTVKVEVQQRTAEMVEQFNNLIDEHRYAEAEVIANRLYEMNPDDLVAQQINNQAKMIRRTRMMDDIKDRAESGFAHSLIDIEDTKADALASMTTPFKYGDNWDAIKGRQTQSELGSSRSIKELEIEQKLQTPVLPKYEEVPLAKVIDGLSQLAGVNIHLDPRGMSQEGVRSDVPVTFNLSQPVSLKSALTLILEPLHLTYTIKDEVLKITSEQIRDGEVYQKVYPVGDLVIPIPNFLPTNNMGLQGLINDAYAAMGAFGPGGGVGGPIAVVAGNQPGQVAGPLANKNINAQQMGAGGGSVPFSSGGAGGPGGLGGAASADFDSLIDLIVSTVEHESWMENGTGEGEIQPFPTNLSLVVSQTQRVHEQIADLLEQLRRLQDLQVTIEVRFIDMSDSFFERIGVDFDFNIRNNSGLTAATYNGGLAGNQTVLNNTPSNTVGTNVGDVPQNAINTNYTVDLDLPFRQGSFGLTTPQFGAPVDVGTFGFAILSDIEAFFMINASQGDRRSNVLQAPKVTLFNGQQAQVVDSAFRPFVISVIPVVGEFAAAQQPVIVVLSEGTMLSVQAVVSDDRRYVRLTLVPFFSQIGEVQEFTFEGSETTSTSGSTTDDDDDGNDESEEEAEEVTRSGTTVQLPTFEVITVSTTVSVPDGGTVLLGGIKRLSEGRNEFGVPLLSKVPYMDRLFRNVGIGRESRSLMMMVTPHIIIQEEEEDRLGVTSE
jgi:general secretion pathway protein D